MGEKHKHAEVIHAFADGAQVQFRTHDSAWTDSKFPDFDPACEYRIKPEPPKYPQTSYSETTLACICHNNGTKKPSLTEVANMAIARAILDGDVVPAAMLEKVAKDAAAYGYNKAGGYAGLYIGPEFYNMIKRAMEGK